MLTCCRVGAGRDNVECPHDAALGWSPPSGPWCDAGEQHSEAGQLKHCWNRFDTDTDSKLGVVFIFSAI